MAAIIILIFFEVVEPSGFLGVIFYRMVSVPYPSTRWLFVPMRADPLTFYMSPLFCDFKFSKNVSVEHLYARFSV